MGNKLLQNIISAILGTLVVCGVLYSIVMLSYSKGINVGIEAAVPFVFEQGVELGAVRYNEETDKYQWIECELNELDMGM